MYQSPRLMPITTINAAYGYGGPFTLGLVNCTVSANVNSVANVNVGSNVNVLGNVNAAVAVNAAAASNAIAVALVVCHYTPLGKDDPRIGEDAKRLAEEHRTGDPAVPLIGR